MLPEREIHEIIARCISIVVFYQAGDRTGELADRGASEIRAQALEIGARGISAGEARQRIVEPVRLEILARYGPSEGTKIGQAFADAFAGDDPLDDGWPGGMRHDRARVLMHEIG